MSKKIVFSTIPVDCKIDLLDKENQNIQSLNQFKILLNIDNFDVYRIYFFINKSNHHNIKKIFNYIKSVVNKTKIKFIKVQSSYDFSVDSFKSPYLFFSNWLCNFKFNKDDYYYFYFAKENLFFHTFMLIMIVNYYKINCEIISLRKDENSNNLFKIITYSPNIGNWISKINNFEKKAFTSSDLLKSSICTKNIRFNKIIKDIEHVALNSTSPILLLGPTGSGKTQLAQRIYQLRKTLGRVRGAFISINCATLESQSAHSTLFGHIKGAFTGAIDNRKGLLKMADGGVLFLDEVGELSLDMQSKLLKALEDKSYFPLGGDKEVYSNFQLICATNQNLILATQENKFRKDFFARINFWEFELPSLSERPEDIEPNIDYELLRISKEKGIIVQFSPQARKIYLSFATSPNAIWPGNFRSLIGSIERMATYSIHGIISENIVIEEITLLSQRWAKNNQNKINNNKHISFSYLDNKYKKFVLFDKLCCLNIIKEPNKFDIFDIVQLEEVLNVCKHSISCSDAGKFLFSFSRTQKNTKDDTTRLNKYLKKFDLSFNKVKQNL